MKSFTTRRFRKAFAALPKKVKDQARNAYRIFLQNPQAPTLKYKRIHADEAVYSVRVGRDYRALGVKSSNDIIWFWIGSHADYDKLIDNF